MLFLVETCTKNFTMLNNGKPIKNFIMVMVKCKQVFIMCTLFRCRKYSCYTSDSEYQEIIQEC